MKLINLWPNYNSFKKDIIDNFDLVYNKPFWNDETKCYTPNEIIYDSLISYYYNRELCVDSKIWIGQFRILYSEFKPYMYKRQLIFYNENIEKLKEMDNWGKLNIKNDEIEKNIILDKKYESNNKDLTSYQNNETTFNKLNDEDKVSNRNDTKLNIEENNKSEEKISDKNKEQEYDINNKLYDINSKTIFLGLADFIAIFNQLFLPYKILKNTWNIWH